MIKQLRLAIILIIAVAAQARGADREAFVSPNAKRAQAAYATALAKAEDEYRKALIAADEQYLKDLKDSLEQAMKNKNLEEANRIDAAIKKVQIDLAQRRPKAAAPIAAKADPLAGAWRISKADGSGAFVIVLAPDGSVAAKSNGSRGTWKAEDRQLVFHWSNGFVDTFDLAEGAELTGKNNSGAGLKLVRVND